MRNMQYHPSTILTYYLTKAIPANGVMKNLVESSMKALWWKNGVASPPSTRDDRACKMQARRSFQPLGRRPVSTVSPWSHCHPLDTKWVGLKRLTNAEYNTQHCPRAAPHTRPAVWQVLLRSQVIWCQSSCWVGPEGITPQPATQHACHFSSKSNVEQHHMCRTLQNPLYTSWSQVLAKATHSHQLLQWTAVVEGHECQSIV